MSPKYEPSSEPLHISVKQLFATNPHGVIESINFRLGHSFGIRGSANVNLESEIRRFGLSVRIGGPRGGSRWWVDSMSSTGAGGKIGVLQGYLDKKPPPRWTLQ